MDVIRHEAPREDAPPVSAAHVVEKNEVAPPVDVVEEDRLPTIATACDMTDAG
jgi:hypothetical protein